MVDAGPDPESPTRPNENASSWTINWINVIPLLLIGAIIVFAWSWLEGTSLLSQDDDPAGELEASATSAPIGTSEAAVAAPPRGSPTTTRPARPSSTPPTTIAEAPGRRVLISGEMKPCQFGSNCLVASFMIEGFEEHPGRFVCVYPNSRSDFGFSDADVDDACITADEGDTITIEVDGVRSATISERDLDGTATRN